MQKIKLLVLFSFTAIILKAQTDTAYLYFNKDWKVVAKENAFFYGKVFKEGEAWHRQDFWASSNIMQMDAYFSDAATKNMQGVAKHYAETGAMEDSSLYINGYKKYAVYYYPNRAQKAYVLFDTAENVLEQKGWNTDGTPIDNYVYQKQAAFAGGAEKWQKYLVNGLQKNLPKEYKKGNIWGKVVVTFTVMQDGAVGDVKVKTSSGYAELDAHAVDIITKSPAWIPAIQFNVPVKFYQQQMITYPQPQ